MNYTKFKRPMAVRLVETPVGFVSGPYELAVGRECWAIGEVGKCYVLAEVDEKGHEMVLLKDYFKAPALV